jgi:hypothetical protein
MSHTPSDAITADSKINRAATSARALAALAGSCVMEERLSQLFKSHSAFRLQMEMPRSFATSIDVF